MTGAYDMMDKTKLLVWADLLIYYGVLMFCATIPFSISLATGGLFGGAFGWMLRCALRKEISWRASPLDTILVIFLLIQAASVLFSIDKARSLHQLRAYWHVLPFLLLVQGDFTDKRIGRILDILIAAGSISAAYGIGQWLVHAVTGSAGSPAPRISGTFGMYMTYAGILSMIWAITLNQGNRGDIPAIRRFLYIVALLIVVWALALTHTRMALLAVVGAGTVFLGLKRTKLFFASCALIVLALLVSPGLRQAALPIIWSSQTPTMDTNRMIPWADQRPYLWKGAYRIIKDHPWTGVGLANFRLAYKAYLPYDLQKKTYHHAHNNFLHLGAETGLPGLAAFIVLNIMVLLFLIRSYGRATGATAQACIGGVLCAFAGFHVAGLFEYNFGDSEVAMLFWTIVGMAMAARKSSA